MKTTMTRPALRCAAAMLGAVLLAGCTADLNQRPDDSAGQRAIEANRLLSEGVHAQKAGRLDAATDFYKRSVELNPNLSAAWNNLGIVLMEQVRYLDAAAAFKRAAEVSTDPNDARPYANLGLVYNDAGFSEQSLQYYQLALDRDPNWLPALRGTALAARKLNKSDDRLAEAMRRGLMVETDIKWRDVFERERLRIDGALREQERSRAAGR